MQPNFTLKNLKPFYVRISLVTLAFILFVNVARSQVLFNEGFTTVVPTGWASQNNSSPIGAQNWFQGNTTVFNANSGATNSYAAANYQSGAGTATLSNWLFAPTITIKNGDIFTFYTRATTGGGAFPDRLQIRMSSNGASTNVGTTATSLGDFTTLLLDINPTYSTTAYPEVWTQYTITISGVPTPVSGRLAFRHFVENGGPNGANSNYIGIDDAVYTTFAAACSGTPVPGNTQSSSTSVCSGINFTLSLVTPPTASGLTYQWQSATAVAGPYTNVATGGTTSTYTTSQTVATYYRCNITCTSSGQSAASTPIQVAMNPATSCYCTPLYTNGCSGFGDYIANVKLGTLNNTSTCTPSPFFTYYSSVPAPTIIQTGTQTLTCSFGPDGTQYFGAWIDYNQDGVFSASEFLGGSGNAGANGTISITFTVPATSLLGTTRLRVRGGDDVAPTSGQSCGASGSTFGETEDYNVIIAPCVPVVLTKQPLDTVAVCGGNARFTVVATGSLPVYQWQQRISATAPWTTVTNGIVGGVTFAGATSDTLKMSNVPSSYSGYSYRVLVSGACTAIDFSTAGTLTVTPLIAIVNPASATICAGSIQPLSLTNAASSTTTTFASAPALNIVIPDAAIFPGTVCDAGINHTIPVTLPAGAVVTNVNVKININHTYIGDLVIVLKSPNGKILNLDYHRSSTGNGGLNMVNTVFSPTGTLSIGAGTAPFTAIYKADAVTGAGVFGDAQGTGPTGYSPNTALFSDLYSTLPAGLGNWTIAIADPNGWNGDNGVLVNWSMDITYGAPVVGVWTPFTGLYSDALATIPYTGTPVTTVYAKPAVSTNYSVTFSTATCTTPPTIVPVNVSTPVTGLAITANSAGCVGGSATFTATTTGGGPVTYQWQESPPSGTSFTDLAGATSATLTLSNLTTATTGYKYRVIATAAGCGSVTSSVGTLKVNVLPKISISTSNTQLTPGVFTSITGVADSASVAGGGFSWTLNGSAVVRGNGLTTLGAITIDSVGSYQATYKDKNGCVSAASNIIVIGSQQSDRLWIYPNPSPGQFQVRLYYSGTPTEKRVVTIYNQLGEKVITKSFSLDNAGNNYLRMDFDLSKNQAGTYLVKVNGQYYGQEKAGFVIIQK